jgi:putative MFS transporter
MIVFRRRGAFWIGIAAIGVGVLLHVLTYPRAADRGYVPAGTPMDGQMKTGMALLALGMLLTAYGIGPHRGEFDFGAVARVRVQAIAEAPLRRGHAALLAVATAAAVINVLKMITRVPDVWLPLSALGGVVLGFLFLGRVGDRIGRRAAILLAGLAFIATAIGGATPSFSWNVLMSFLMGMAVGALLPLGSTLVAETVPARHRSRLLLLIAGTVAAAYLLTNLLAAVLVPEYGWPVLWLIGLPAGALLILLNRWIPESPRFLLATGRVGEATAVLNRFGAAFVYEDRRSSRTAD